MSANASPVTTGSLVNEMVDMHGLTRFPSPSYKIVQFSSYDRRSSLPGGPDWFANSDGFGGEPIPNFEGVIRDANAEDVGEYLICDVEGPGAIVRTWSAAMPGTVRVYLDGNESPVYDGPALEFFMHPYSGYAQEQGLDVEVLKGTFYQSEAAYCPMPFAERCRVEWTGDMRKIHFYHLQIRRYKPGTNVTTFEPADLGRYGGDIRHVAAVMADPDGRWPYASTETPRPVNVTVGPGEVKEALVLAGPGAIEKLTLAVEAPDRDLALRQTVMHVVCDDYPHGQVQCPIGDFFGAAPGVNPYTCVPFTVAPDGAMTCRYVMPFAAKLRILFENFGAQPVTVRGEALPMRYDWDETSMHFRARWRITHGMVGPNDAPQDVPYLIANGRGLYVGSAAYLLNPCDIPSGHGSWWGEGDEKVFTDGDIQPAIFGTGSEDYFNYAWGPNTIFAYPYCGQPRTDGPANRGFVTNNRWHILDAMPFAYRLSFYLEFWPHEATEGTAYARIGYHYGAPGLMDDHVLITGEDVRRQDLPANWRPAARLGAANSVFFEPEEHVHGKRAADLVEGALWSGGTLYRWRPERTGEELSFSVPIEQHGEYIIRMCFAMDADSGRVSLKVDDADAKLGGGIADLYRPYRVMSRCVGTRKLALEKGDHALTLRYEGARDESPRASVGIDFIWIQKQ